MPSHLSRQVVEDRSDEPMPMVAFTIVALIILSAAMAIGALIAMIEKVRL